uniref:Putative phage tail assembly protein n=1 Tax=Edwardsiella phage eiDWF TaxID=945084 RepID=E7EKW0_9VIRU|nr:putative phage tail assembly protein [Edwardsiella phage eiDWF]
MSTTTEAVKALCVTLDGFEEYLLHAKKNGMTFAVFRGRKNIGAEELHDGIGNDEIRIAPVIEGSKKGGLFQTILGAVLVVAGVGLTIFSGGALASFGAQMAWAGAAVMAGGLYQMLSPQPRGLQSREDPDNRPSYAFGGPVNTTAMGNPIGVLWGTREIGGAIISAGIVAEDVA